MIRLVSKTAAWSARVPPALSGFCSSLVAPACVGLFALITAGPASAQLMVHPTRIILEGTERSAQLEVVNNSDRAATYHLSVVNRRMDESGGFSEVQTPVAGEQFADGMLRYSPRRITLAPGAAQVVRVMVSKPADLAAGEYRSHLLFAEQLLPKDILANDGAPAEGLGVSLVPLVGISIPVIVREGDTSAAVSLSDLAVRRAAGQSPIVAMDMHRSGNRSAYGDLVATFTPVGGIPAEVGRAGGVAIYVPNAIRHAELPLRMPAGMVLRNGTLTVIYQGRPEDGGELIAQASLAL